MEQLGNIVEFFENRTILVTGATGYLAKIFVEKVLRIQPNVKKLYLLLRAKDSNSATERFNNEVIGKDLFKVLKEKYGANLYSFVTKIVTPIPGDISDEDLGIKDPSLRDNMFKEIDVVINFAATTNFDERYDVALGINTMGPLHVLNFAKKCLKIRKIVHVSTAYVCGEDTGLILEKPFPMGIAKKGTDKIDVEEENKLMQEKLNELQSNNYSEKEITEIVKDFGIERARLFGWPNTYVFTKAMGEMLLVNYKDNLPLIIIRPTMITSTIKEPFPGWIEGVKTIDSVIVGYAKGRITCFVSNPQSILDVIPADMVVNGILVAMISREKENSSEIIYQIGSSLRNPLKFSKVHDFVYRYFSAKPWINKDGNPVKITSKGIVLSSMARFHMYMAVRFQLPLKALKLANSMVLRKYDETYMSLNQKIILVMKLVELYKPYVFFEGIIDDTNSEKLRMTFKSEASLKEADGFNFDPTTIDWEDYMMNVHIPGLLKYVMK